MSRRFWAWLVIALGGLYLLLPLYATAEFALRGSRPRVPYSLVSFSVLLAPGFVSAFLFSLEMASLTIVAGLLLVVPTVYWLHLRLPRWRPAVELVTLVPFVVPAIVLVFGLQNAYFRAPLFLNDTDQGTDGVLVCAYLVLALPYMYRAVDVGLGAIDVRALTEAAASLGASWPATALRVILPNLRQALLSAAFLTLATVLGEFTITKYLVVGAGAFAPYMAQSLLDPYQQSALAILSFVMTWASMGLIQLLARGRAAGGTVAVVR